MFSSSLNKVYVGGGYSNTLFLLFCFYSPLYWIHDIIFQILRLEKICEYRVGDANLCSQ